MFLFFPKRPIKNLKNAHCWKTNISLFPADIHTYKLTFVSFFFCFFHLPLMKIIWKVIRYLDISPRQLWKAYEKWSDIRIFHPAAYEKHMKSYKISGYFFHPGSLAFKHFSHSVAVISCSCSLQFKHWLREITFLCCIWSIFTRVNSVDLVQFLCCIWNI